MSQQPKYKITPSLLDAFQTFLDTNYEEYFVTGEDGKWHKNWNDETGYLVEPDEIDRLAKQALIDYINRVPTEPSEAADKGTCFNEIVDCIVMGIPSTRNDVTIKSRDGYVRQEVFGCIDPWDGKVTYADVEGYEVKQPHIEAKMDGFTFMFDIALCKNMADYYKRSLCQQFVSAPMETKYGLVELYGYSDYIREDKVYDLKTTSKYEFGKYGKKWQRYVYPYTLLKSGECTDITSFEYTCCVFSGGTSKTPIISGKVFPEVYTVCPERDEQVLRNHVERFIEFLEDNRSLITDRKVFGGLIH